MSFASWRGCADGPSDPSGGAQRGRRPVGARNVRCYPRTDSFRSGFGPEAVPEVGARPLFLCREEDCSEHHPALISRPGSPPASPTSRCCSRRSSAARRCASSSTIPTASRSRCASASRTRCAELRERYALEVSSPGIERPLTKPQHFRRFLGRRARVRTRDAVDGHKSFTGELVGASDDAVTIAADGDRRRRDPVRRDPAIQPRGGVAHVTRDP